MDGQTSTFPRQSSWSDEQEVEARGEFIDRKWRAAGVPRRYLAVPPYDGDLGWAYLEGCVGAGKTYLACQMLRAFIERHTRRLSSEMLIFDCPKAHFLTATDYLDRLRDGYDTRERSNPYRTCAFLVLDDLGQERPTQWAVEQLFALINARYNDDLPTVITSQFPLGGIAKRLAEAGGREQAEAIASRLMGSCTYYRLAARDRRLA